MFINVTSNGRFFWWLRSTTLNLLPEKKKRQRDQICLIYVSKSLLPLLKWKAHLFWHGYWEINLVARIITNVSFLCLRILIPQFPKILVLVCNMILVKRIDIRLSAHVYIHIKCLIFSAILIVLTGKENFWELCYDLPICCLWKWQFAVGKKGSYRCLLKLLNQLFSNHNSNLQRCYRSGSYD